MEDNLNITIYSSDVFGTIRTAGTADEPFFCLADVCNALGLTAKVVNQRLGDEVVSKYPIVDSLGRVQNALFVNEDGLYDVILDSRKPEAKAFRKWITAEVLPQIRKTGGYIPVSADDDDMTLLSKALIVAQRTIEQRNVRIDELEETVAEQKDEILKLAPKAEAFDKMTLSDSTYTATQLAKEFGYPNARAVYDKLISQKVLFHQSNTYMPYKKWADKGFFSYRTHTIERSNGSVETHTYLVFTEKFRTLILRSRHRRAMESI